MACWIERRFWIFRDTTVHMRIYLFLPDIYRDRLLSDHGLFHLMIPLRGV